MRKSLAFALFSAALLAAPAAAQAVLDAGPVCPLGQAHPLIVLGAPPQAPYVLDLGLSGTVPGTPLGGGAMLALVGGVVAAGFAFYLEKPVWTDWRLWENDILVGLGLLLLAGLAAILGRG